MTLPTYTTTPARAALGLVAGGLTGATAWTVSFLVLTALTFPWTSDFKVETSEMLALAGAFAVIGLGVFAVYGVGLLLLGAPLWALLHRAGRRGRASPIALGAGLNFTAVTPWIVGLLLSGMTQALAIPAAALAIGAVAGWVIWRVAYRRAA